MMFNQAATCPPLSVYSSTLVTSLCWEAIPFLPALSKIAPNYSVTLKVVLIIA